MKRRGIALLTLGLLMTQVSAEETQKPLDEADKFSYTIGYQIGTNLKQQGIEINQESLVKGIADVFANQQPPRFSESEMKQTLSDFKKERVAKMQAEREQQASKNLKEGEAFLADNAKKEGVVTLASGLQYQVITPGTGNTPKATDKVITHYRGTLIDGTEFDSSYERGNPANFPVKGVIAGWTEALQLMKEGAKWQLFVPENLAYGKRGAGGKIGPNATLIFEIELISIVAE